MNDDAPEQDARLREVAVPVATLWTSPQAPRDQLDAAAVSDSPDMAAWVATLDAEGTAERRLGLHGRTLTQLLMGEPVLVLEEHDEWARVAVPGQSSSAGEHGYPGWLRRAHLGAPAASASGVRARVVTPTATATLEDGRQVELSCGTALGMQAAHDREVTVALPGGRRARLALPCVALAHRHQQATFGPDDLLATARQFLGVRYLWGGLSGWGLDCSGLVHLTLRSHRVALPRDAFDQQSSPVVRAVGLDAVQPGDLYFFARPGDQVYHVGFVSRAVQDGERWMLHAPEGGAAAIEDAPLAPHRAATLVAAGRVVKPDSGQLATYGG